MSVFINDGKRIRNAVLIGIIVSLVLCVLLTCIFALVVKFMSGVPYGIIDYVMIGVEGLSVLIGAYIASAIAKNSGLIIGLICAGISLVILFACGMSISGNDIGILTIIRIAAVLICGIAGGIVGVNRKEKVHIK